MAARNFGIEVRPVRYVSSTAPTIGMSTSDIGDSAAAAVPPRNNSRFQRYRNASARYRPIPAVRGSVIARPRRRLERVDDVANLEDVLHELGLALHLLRRKLRPRHAHF